jgi:hypothetical protein
LFAVIIAVMVVAMVIFLWDARNWALVSPEGFTTSGTRLGLAIGDERTSAAFHLARLGYVLTHSQKSGDCLTHAYRQDDNIDIYFDYSWRHGVICVASSKGRITALESETLAYPLF